MPIETYSLEEVEKAEALLKIAENVFNQSGSDIDKEKYEESLSSFKNILMRHKIISEIKAYQFRNDENNKQYFKDIFESLENKFNNYFGEVDLINVRR